MELVRNELETDKVLLYSAGHDFLKLSATGDCEVPAGSEGVGCVMDNGVLKALSKVFHKTSLTQQMWLLEDKLASVARPT